MPSSRVTQQRTTTSSYGPEIRVFVNSTFPSQNMPGENRPLPWKTARKVSNKELDACLEVSKQATNFAWNPRIIDANENMLPGEICAFFAVAPFGRYIRCLVIQRPTLELLKEWRNK